MDERMIAQEREAFGEILGLTEPVSEAVLSAAVENDAYARNLLLCRRDPELLEHLLRNPPRRAPRFHRRELALRAASALARWAKTGFTFVDQDVLSRRLAACHACPDLVVGKVPTCAQCGCRVEWKARLSSESCPAVHDNTPGLTRWGEPLTATTTTTRTEAR